PKTSRDPLTVRPRRIETDTGSRNEQVASGASPAQRVDDPQREESEQGSAAPDLVSIVMVETRA
ncbi:MAG: hypothetical protein WBP81_34925, partial [Solirubrobacteraceae bacterium]